MRKSAVLIILAAILVACLPQSPSVDEQVRLAVGQTLAAMPTSTVALPAAPLPTATEAPLSGIFCEYAFCIGHPTDLAFYDVIAKQNPNSPTASKYADGTLAANNSGLFIEVRWQQAAPGSDPQLALNLILDNSVDVRSGASENIQIDGTAALYVPVQSSATSMLPYGGAAAWSCGDRFFGWKTYTSQSDLARRLLLEALRPFRCSASR